MSQYSPEDINEFQMKDKRIMFQSIFSSLCSYYGHAQENITPEQMEKEAYIIVEKLIKAYPMMIIDEHIKNQSQGLPF